MTSMLEVVGGILVGVILLLLGGIGDFQINYLHLRGQTATIRQELTLTASSYVKVKRTVLAGYIKILR